MTGRFTHKNEAFTCQHCAKHVPPASSGCRNHCPFCLTSKHVDVFPGDRANPCQGLLRAISYHMDSQKGLMLDFKCDGCGAITRNIANRDDPICPDNYEKILYLTPKAH